ncbi:hypothetical protein CYMTET_24596 [Cymbomonas tetramitiformis]|uniref:Uncharacterized protein n=1 Tax=Cymbomonas tetramitiformis TaxID=36881 RepID=A0AAE0L045_9CHLO|nr:hypothetical protein CYMTET_24596 [Cymbomonas tetramitiformis]
MTRTTVEFGQLRERVALDPQELPAAMYRQNRYRYTTRQEEEDAKNFRCFSCSFGCSSFMAIVGVYLLTASNYHNTKSEELVTYNHGVEEWTSDYGPQFNATSWSLTVDGFPITLVPLSKEDPLPKDGAEDDTLSYTPLKFTLPSVVPVPPNSQKDSSASEEPKAPLNTTGATVSNVTDLMRPREALLTVYDGVETHQIALPSTPLLRKVVKRTAGWKMCRYQEAGYYSGRSHTCTTYGVLESMCVKVSKSVASGAWELNTTYGGSGCNPRSSWRMFAWRRARAPTNGGLPKLPAVETDRIFANTVVKSAYDPRILALNITNGKLVFAQGQAEELATGLVLIIIGAVCMVPACFLAVPTFQAWRARRKRMQYYQSGGDSGDDDIGDEWYG